MPQIGRGWPSAALIHVTFFVSSSIDAQVQLFYCHPSKHSGGNDWGHIWTLFWCTWIWGPLGSTSLSLLHWGHHVTLLYGPCHGWDNYQCFPVSSCGKYTSTQSPIWNIGVVAFLSYCCLYCHWDLWLDFIVKALAEDNVITISSQ